MAKEGYTKIPNSFIKEAYDEACEDWKQKILNVAPELFNTTFEINTWYTDATDSSDEYMFCVTRLSKNGRPYGYGIVNGDFFEDDDDTWSVNEDDCEQVSEVTILIALKKLAKNLGLIKGCTFVSLLTENATNVSTKGVYELKYTPGQECVLYLDGCVIFLDGEWAKPIKRLTQKEIEQKLGYKIEIIEE